MDWLLSHPMRLNPMCVHLANTTVCSLSIYYTWRVSCIWLPTNTTKYCCLWVLKDWRASSNPLTKGPANSLTVTLVLLIISSFCLLAFNQCLFNPYHLLYRLSHVFHLLDNNLSLPYTGWYSQCIPMPYMAAKHQWLAHNH